MKLLSSSATGSSLCLIWWKERTHGMDYDGELMRRQGTHTILMPEKLDSEICDGEIDLKDAFDASQWADSSPP